MIITFWKAKGVGYIFLLQKNTTPPPPPGRPTSSLPPSKMRPLTESETQILFSKLANYTGRSLTHLIAAPTSSSPLATTTTSTSASASASTATATTTNNRNVFRLHHSRVYYMPLAIANLATSIRRENLVSVGTCLGKFTKKTGKFRLHITALDVIGPHARFKVWIKPNGEMPFLYGGNVLKAHVGRWSEDCPEHQGVVVYSMNDTPLVSLFFKKILFFYFYYCNVFKKLGGFCFWAKMRLKINNKRGSESRQDQQRRLEDWNLRG